MTFSPASDIDIAILLPYNNSNFNEKLLDLIFELSTATGREIDIINLRKANTVLQFEIIYNSICFLDIKKYERETFEMLTTSFYQRLEYERAGIIKEIKRSGRVFKDE
ncbi:MAG: nucleotidyltransferase domain-containing protein [Spirochaetales bacterium]|nr:nucleotidyltransferase domain-containing protein [Spirochaetales bacterium]